MDAVLFSVSDSSLDGAGRSRTRCTLLRDRPILAERPELTLRFLILLFYRRRRPLAFAAGCLRFPCVLRGTVVVVDLQHRPSTCRIPDRQSDLPPEGPAELISIGQFCVLRPKPMHRDEHDELVEVDVASNGIAAESIRID